MHCKTCRQCHNPECKKKNGCKKARHRLSWNAMPRSLEEQEHFRSIPMTPCRGNPTMTFYIKLVAFSIIFYGLVYALPLASSCCDSDAKSSTLQFQVWCLTLFQRRPVKARWRGCCRHLDNKKTLKTCSKSEIPHYGFTSGS